MRKRTVFFAAVFLLLCSCGTKVKARHLAPARFPVGGIHKLAVAEFHNPTLTVYPWGKILSDRITSKLKSENFFEVVLGDTGTGPSSIDESGVDPRWRRWGELYNVDGVLTGDITDVGVIKDIYHDKRTREVHTGRYRNEVYVEGGQVRKRRVEIIDKVTEFIPIITKSARLKVTVTLLDVATGSVIQKESYSARKRERKEGEVYLRDIVTDREILERLVNEISSKVVKDMVPHPVVENINVLTERGCKEGAELAKDGRWAEAEQSWRGVLAAEPDNDAAMYNLGVAAEVAGRYGEAANRYLNAMELTGKKSYKKAWERANRLDIDKEKLDEQMEGRHDDIDQ